MTKMLRFVWILMQCSYVLSDFVFPDVKLEAFDPEGFRVTVAEMKDINSIGFHANKNQKIDDISPGEISTDIIRPADNGWSYYNPNLKLNVGDKIYYWMFVQHKNLGYKKPGQSWTVTELIPSRELNKTNCRRSLTEALTPTIICEKQLIFDGLFLDKKINERSWKLAHYIPSFPDYEFCSYQKRDDNIFIKDRNLVIKPIAATRMEEVSGTLDLREGCTSHSENDCIAYEDSGFILPPVRSAKMKTNQNFKYGTVEIKAKLPAGDWLYPEIYLESSKNKSKKIWIAYARGNQHLYGNGGDDIGGTLLFGGPSLTFAEPERSKYLSTSRGKKPFVEDFHVYSVVWKPDKISVYVDDLLYGETKADVASIFDEPMHVVLGVGVGGLTDFPDYYVSTNNKRKPWKDSDRLIYKNFFKARDDWLPTWTSEGSCLKVEYVKIFAL
ncbi:beta-1,3-glucan-binding protein 1-like [Coccinella septempunctata]|uniref:beta-1,3-glucan-binding protein 1-like n=1 Tax=Coccinella septempunctata TaxID=41139 RepID=UPI001D08B68D|nr:beta-1,3-glucan-binding protein 1-like [Coccinella septempunctata]